MQDRAAAVASFRTVVGTGQASLDLFEGALAIASPEYPDLDSAALRVRLASWAAGAVELVAQNPDARPTPAMLAAVCHVLFKEVGLRGDLDHYSDPRNSFLNEVMERKLGLPITLSVLFVEVARRVGLDAHGVAFPGHFLARVEDPDDDGTFVVVDSFSGGSILGLDNLAQLLADAVGGPAPLSPDMLEPATPRVVLARMLRNLKASYAQRKDMERALLAQERILVLHPDDPPEVRDHGLLLARAGETAAAIVQMERYLLLAPEAADAREVEGALHQVRRERYNIQ